MIVVNGPRSVSVGTLTGPLCLTVSGASGSFSASLLAAPFGVRMSVNHGEMPTICLHIPPGTTGTVTIRIRGGGAVTRTMIKLRP